MHCYRAAAKLFFGDGRVLRVAFREDTLALAIAGMLPFAHGALCTLLWEMEPVSRWHLRAVSLELKPTPGHQGIVPVQAMDAAVLG